MITRVQLGSVSCYVQLHKTFRLPLSHTLTRTYFLLLTLNNTVHKPWNWPFQSVQTSLDSSLPKAWVLMAMAVFLGSSRRLCFHQLVPTDFEPQPRWFQMAMWVKTPAKAPYSLTLIMTGCTQGLILVWSFLRQETESHVPSSSSWVVPSLELFLKLPTGNPFLIFPFTYLSARILSQNSMYVCVFFM